VCEFKTGPHSTCTAALMRVFRLYLLASRACFVACLRYVRAFNGRWGGAGVLAAPVVRAGSVGCGRRRAPENNGSVWVELELEVDLP